GAVALDCGKGYLSGGRPARLHLAHALADDRGRGALCRRPPGAADSATLQSVARHHRHPRHGRTFGRGQGHGRARAQDRAVSVTALPCRRSVHWRARRVRRTRRYHPRLQGPVRRKIRLSAGGGVLHGRHHRASRGEGQEARGGSRVSQNLWRDCRPDLAIHQASSLDGPAARPPGGRARKRKLSMATFPFDLVSPEEVVCFAKVSQADVPGSEGDFGVLAAHAPLVTTLRPGILVIHGERDAQRIVVDGGFAEVGPAGLTVLANLAVPVDEFDVAELAGVIKDTEEDVADETEGWKRDKLAQKLDRLKALQAALGH